MFLLENLDSALKKENPTQTQLYTFAHLIVKINYAIGSHQHSILYSSLNWWYMHVIF